MSKNDDLREQIRKRFGQNKRSQAEIEAELREITKNSPIFRFELTYDAETNVIKLQANAEALRSLQEILGDLASLKPGSSIEFDEHTSLTETNVRLFMIMHVADHDEPPNKTNADD